MRDRIKFIESACDAMIAGDPEGCAAALDRFRTSVAKRALDDAETAQCSTQLERLRGLAASACVGIAAAQEWLAELAQAAGGLNVYDREGRQRVTTELSSRPTRF